MVHLSYICFVSHNQVLLQVYEFSFGNGIFFGCFFYKFHAAHACKLLIFLTFLIFWFLSWTHPCIRKISPPAIFVTFCNLLSCFQYSLLKFIITCSHMLMHLLLFIICFTLCSWSWQLTIKKVFKLNGLSQLKKFALIHIYYM